MDENTKQNIKKQVFGQRYTNANLGSIALGEREVEAIHRWITKEKSICFVTGKAGTGKTYLCAASYDYLLEKYNGRMSLKYFSEPRFYSQIRSSQDGEYYPQIEHAASSKFVFYDDLGACGLTDWRRETFFSFIDIRYSSQLPTMIVSNLSDKEIYESFGSRIHSRIFAEDNIIVSFDNLPSRRL